ncbi:hypothetical protein BDY19DRAFT_951733 [Irpex rosettiformis]|uniref:Uncharacterized protein n=1 Tax=Irpex rosettiformis TaxID=378272 RepID=A0ACB8U1I6_9APHY|nr:hypothetical protein BDY19DRAFT_951733 [Irpex rosettiformis]
MESVWPYLALLSFFRICWVFIIHTSAEAVVFDLYPSIVRSFIKQSTNIRSIVDALLLTQFDDIESIYFTLISAFEKRISMRVPHSFT